MADTEIAKAVSPIPNDVDPAETAEWLESLDYVLERKGSERVQQLLGSPSTEGSFGQDIWYYVSKKTSQTGFFEPDVIDQGVLAVTFDQEGVVNDLKIYDQNDGRLVAMVDRVTPTHGNEMTILQQLLGNLGRFDPESSSKPTTGTPSGL